MKMDAQAVKKRRTKAKGCKCREQIDEHLKPYNTRLEPIVLMHQSPMRMSIGMAVSTVKIESKNRAPKKTVLAVYCPLCGKKFPE
jgi:hypothetical protein